MADLLSAAQMRQLEQSTINSGAVSGATLMERAGQGVVQAMFATWPDLAATDHKAVVLCGPGNNGGDGYVIARLLHQWGWQVSVFHYGGVNNLPADARLNHQRWRELGAVLPLSDLTTDMAADVCIDALFGTGLSRAVGTDILTALRTIKTDTRCVAVDIPSGLCADSGRFIGNVAAPHADLTVTFHSAKPGHYLAQGPEACGRLHIHDIGLPLFIPKISPPEASGPIQLVQPPAARSLSKSGTGHKYGHGHALILSGGPGHGGAARLAARGALRIGAGLVSIACPPEALAEHSAQLNAIMVRIVADRDGLRETLKDHRLNALCLGPGLGRDAAAGMLVQEALASRRALVLDADALTPELLGQTHANVVLSPHAGEFARMFPDLAERLAAPAISGPAFSKADATRLAAERAGCVVLFKGADTVIAEPGGACAIHSAAYGRSAAGLATAGSGDVLAGFITGLLARGLAPMQAAQTGAWLHTECARLFGPGLIAEDLPESLPEVLRGLGA